MSMKTREFLEQLDESKVVAEIATAEQSTTGEIRVFVSGHSVADAVSEAKLQFEKLGMTRTALRNGVLLYFAPLSQKFAIVGDQGIHERCGAVFWEQVVAGVGTHLRSGSFTEGVTHGVRTVGQALAAYFPAPGGGPDELPNTVVRD